MHKDLDILCRALDALATAVTTGWTQDQTFGETWGWNCPTVTRHDMAAVASYLAQDIRSANPEELDEPILSLAQDYPRRITFIQTQTVPQFWSGNSGPAVSAYLATLDSLRQNLFPILGWQVVPDPKAMPNRIARRVRAIQAEVDQLVPDMNQLASQIHDIQQAHTVADSLPLDLQALAAARDRLVRLAEESTDLAVKVKSNSNEASNSLITIKSKQDEAEKLVDKCEEAYRITTTKGLAAAFDQRAKGLNHSIQRWVAGLLIALVAAAYLGSRRVELLSTAISSQEPQWEVIWMHVVLSLLSIGAPIWLAWLATKQIGQRFRLSEDYAFKASVAKAYEGYRKEAARIDSAFEARLFSSALARLEEAPLRLVEKETHGSPWHELFATAQFQQALSLIPGLKDKFIEVAKEGFSGLPPVQGGEKNRVDETVLDKVN